MNYYEEKKIYASVVAYDRVDLEEILGKFLLGDFDKERLIVSIGERKFKIGFVRKYIVFVEI